MVSFPRNYDEIVKNIRDKRISVNYFRQHDGVEFDFVLSNGLSSNIFIEYKSILPVSIRSLKAIPILRTIAPKAPVVIFHTGSEYCDFGDNVHGVPMGMLAHHLSLGAK